MRKVFLQQYFNKPSCLCLADDYYNDKIGGEQSKESGPRQNGDTPIDTVIWATSSSYLNHYSSDYLIIAMMTRLEETAWGAVGTGPSVGWGATYRFGDDFLSSS